MKQNVQKQIQIQKILDSFYKEMSDLNSALLLLSQATQDLNSFKESLSEFEEEKCLTQLKNIKIFLKTSQSKFKANRLKLGENLAGEYLDLINQIEQILKTK